MNMIMGVPAMIWLKWVKKEIKKWVKEVVEGISQGFKDDFLPKKKKVVLKATKKHNVKKPKPRVKKVLDGKIKC